MPQTVAFIDSFPHPIVTPLSHISPTETGALFSASVLSLHLAFCAGFHVNSSRIYFQLASARLTEGEQKNRASASEGYFKILCDFSVR